MDGFGRYFPSSGAISALQKPYLSRLESVSYGSCPKGLTSIAKVRPSMRSKVWYAPDLRRYTVTVLDEPFDVHRTLAFQRHDDGWIGAVTIGSRVDLRHILSDELEYLLNKARVMSY